MDVNKIKIKLPTNTQEIVVPLDMQWDLVNREDSIISEEKNIIEQVIGQPPNYELARFSRRPQDLQLNSSTYGGQTQIVYRFNFYSGTTDTWENTYLTRFSENEVRFFSNSYKNSFFKFDLYDSTLPQTQRIYLSIILQTSQSTPFLNDCGVYRFLYLLDNAYTATLTYIDCCGVEQTYIVPAGLPNGSPVTTFDFCGLKNSTATVNATDGVNNLSFSYVLVDALQLQFGEPIILFHMPSGLGEYLSCNCTDTSFPIIYKPEFTLDHYGDQKGYYLYWYEDESLINLSEFYMRVKFFDGKLGTYTTFTVNPQSSYTEPYTIPNDDFYVRVPLFYSNRWYDIIDIVTGNILPTCNWYEYINPPLT
jgi:hypothetical protein